MPSRTKIWPCALVAASLLEPSLAWNLQNLNPLNYIDQFHQALEVRSPQILGGGGGVGGLLSSVVGDVTSLVHHHTHTHTRHDGKLTTTTSRSPHAAASPSDSRNSQSHKTPGLPLASILTPIVSEVHSILPKPVQSVASKVDSIVSQAVSQVGAQPTSTDKQPAQTTHHAILPSLPGVISPVLSDVGSILNTVLPTPVKSILSHEISVVNSILPVTSIVSVVKSEVGSIVSHEVSVVNSMVSAVPSEVKSIVSGVPHDVSSIVSVVQSIVSAAPSEVKSIVSALPSEVHSIVSVVQSDVHSIVSAAPSGVLSVVQSIVTPIASEVKSIVSSEISGLSTGIPIPPVVSIISSIIKSVPQIIPTSLPQIVPSIGVSIPVSIPTILPPILPSSLPPIVPSIPLSLPLPVTLPLPSGVPSILSSVLPPIVSIIPPLPTIIPPVSSIIPPIIKSSTPAGVPSQPPAVSTVPPAVSTVPPVVAPSSQLPATSGIPVPASQGASPSSATLPVFSVSLPATLTNPPPLSPAAATATSVPAGTHASTGFSLASAPNLPSSIMVQPSQTNALPPFSSSTGLPSSMPQIIQPPGGLVAQPNNSTLVQVAFGYALNYPFVANTPDSASQIFAYLPQGLAWGLGIASQNVTMHSLQPYDTSGSLGYITTLAMAYIPSTMVTQLELDLHTAISKVYQNPNKATWTLMNMINPSFPILAGDSVGPGGFGPSSTGSAGGPNASSDGSPLGAGVSGPIRGTSVAIGVGVVAGAAAYGAAMFWIARRYRMRRQSPFERTPSMTETGNYPSGGPGYGSMMGSGAIMSGGRNGYASLNNADERNSAGSGFSSNGRSVREVGISAPIVAENSLGWH